MYSSLFLSLSLNFFLLLILILMQGVFFSSLCFFSMYNSIHHHTKYNHSENDIPTKQMERIKNEQKMYNLLWMTSWWNYLNHACCFFFCLNLTRKKYNAGWLLKILKMSIILWFFNKSTGTTTIYLISLWDWGSIFCLVQIPQKQQDIIIEQYLDRRVVPYDIHSSLYGI